MKYDYIVVGAGSAGCVLASRLSEDPAVQVLLLEAGSPDSDFKIHIPGAYVQLHRSAVDWAFYTEPQAHVLGRRIFQPRGKTLGGSSATNAMAYIRGNRADYDNWAALGNPGWAFADVLPYFCKSEHNEQLRDTYHGQGGPLNVTFAQWGSTPLGQAFVEACAELGMPRTNDFNGAEQAGAGLFQFTIKNGKRHSTATAFLKPAMQRPNLHVRTRAQVKQVLLKNDEAIGVEVYTSARQSEQIFAQKEVILSAGAFASPQILLCSGIGAPETLKPKGIEVKKALHGVGQNLHDHLFFPVSSLCKQKIGANHHLAPLAMLKALGNYLLFNKGILTQSPLEANAFTSTSASPKRVDLQMHFTPVHVGESYDYDLYDMRTYPTHTDGYTILPTLLLPQSRGYVGLHSASTLDAPLIQPNYLQAEADRQVLLEGYRLAANLLDAEAFGPYRLRRHFPPQGTRDEAAMQHILRTVEPVYHPVGTCKMGHDDMAVVDSHLRVHGLGRLRIADASVMPNIVSGNTNAACIMIGEKAADLVKTDH